MKVDKLTPDFVHLRRNFGARPSRARPYRFLVAQYVYVLPAENMEVTSRALTTCGRPVMPMFCIAITYGDADADPPPEPPVRMRTRVGSL